MGSNNIDRLMPARHAGVDEAMLQSFGLIANPAGMQEMMSDSNVVLYVGPDAGKVAPIASYWLYWAHRYRETSMIVISPERFPLADRSDHWLNARHGTEAAVIRALAKIADDNGLIPEGADKAWFAECDVADVCARSGLDVADLTECAILFATGGLGKLDDASTYPAGAVWYAVDDQDRNGARALALAAHNLAITLRTLGQPGGGVLALRNYANMQGSLDVGCHPGLLPGGGSVGDALAGRRFAEAWSTRWATEARSQNGFVRINALPDAPGFGVDALPGAIRSGQVKAMYIAAQSHHHGEDKNQFFSAARDGYFASGDSHIWRPRHDQDLVDALSELEFLVVEDCFESELTEIADVVLPTAMYLEKDGTLTNLDRTVQRLRYVVAPPGDARSSRRHVASVAAILGYDVDVENPSAILDEIAAFVPGYRAISYPRLERGGIQWPAGGFASNATIRLVPGRDTDAQKITIVAD
jgi:predicted molibdopterin-dependent oxidoreductase YjgC